MLSKNLDIGNGARVELKFWPNFSPALLIKVVFIYSAANEDFVRTKTSNYSIYKKVFYKKVVLDLPKP